MHKNWTILVKADALEISFAYIGWAYKVNRRFFYLGCNAKTGLPVRLGSMTPLQDAAENLWSSWNMIMIYRNARHQATVKSLNRGFLPNSWTTSVMAGCSYHAPKPQPAFIYPALRTLSIRKVSIHAPSVEYCHFRYEDGNKAKKPYYHCAWRAWQMCI